jgi:transcriptional regulator with XRE-family HTH domain
MTDDPTDLARIIGARLREARLNARLTVREAAARAGLRGHATLVQYERGAVLPPLHRLAALARVYNVSLASLVVADATLIPVVDLLDRADAAQIGALARLLTDVLDAAAPSPTPALPPSAPTSPAV